jgi:succinate dehydrogenase assembly factor 1
VANIYKFRCVALRRSQLSARGAVPVGMRAEALSLFRSLWRASRLMPTTARKDFVRAMTRSEFELNRLETDVEKLSFLLKVGETQLDNVTAQAEHLTVTFADPRMHGRV